MGAALHRPLVVRPKVQVKPTKTGNKGKWSGKHESRGSRRQRLAQSYVHSGWKGVQINGDLNRLRSPVTFSERWTEERCIAHLGKVVISLTRYLFRFLRDPHWDCYYESDLQTAEY